LFNRLRFGDRLRLDLTPKLECVKAVHVLSAAQPAQT
jgi:hypothetical protein